MIAWIGVTLIAINSQPHHFLEKGQNQAKLSTNKNRERTDNLPVNTGCYNTGDLNLSPIMLLAWALYRQLTSPLSSQKTGQIQAILFEIFTIMSKIVP